MPDPVESPDLRMGELSLAPNLGLSMGGGRPNNEMSQENVNAGIQMAGIRGEGRQALADGAKAAAEVKFTIDPIKDTAKYEGPAGVVRSLLESKQQVNQYQQLYNNMIAENLRKQQQMREHPFGNTLAELAASFARNDPNPYTRAIGQAATRLNPSMQELQGEEQGLLRSAETFATRREAIDAGLLRASETMDARKQAGFTRAVAVAEAAAKNGNDSLPFYQALFKRHGMSEEDSMPMSEALVKQAGDMKKVKQATFDWNKKRAEEDQRIRREHYKATEQIQRSRASAQNIRTQYMTEIMKGTKTDYSKVMGLRLKMIQALNGIETGAQRASANMEARQAELETKYGAIAMLDPEQKLKGAIDTHLRSATGSLGKVQEIAGASANELRQMIAEMDHLLASRGMAGGIQMPSQPAPGMQRSHAVTQGASAKPIDSWDQVPEGATVKDETGARFKKVNGQKVKQ